MLQKSRIHRFLPKHDTAAIDRSVDLLTSEAYQHVPMFRQRLDRAGISPDAIRAVQDLERLPISTRQDYLTGDDQSFLRRGTVNSKCKRSRTTGTSGTPLFVIMNRFEALCRNIYLFDAFRKAAPLSVPFSVADVGVNALRISSGVGKALDRFRLLRVHRISRLWSLPEQARTLANIRAQVLTGPPSCLELVAEEMLRTGIRMKHPARLVAPRGEVLTPRTRQLLHQSFGCKVVDLFSCEEVGNVAWECPQNEGVYHINSNACVVGIVDGHERCVPDGTEGDVVVTNLFNWTMPFIRYNLGDRATLQSTTDSPCDCGHTGPSMKVLAGRADDFILLPSGGRVSPRTIVGLVYQAARRDGDIASYYVRRFRVEQVDIDTIRVLIVPSSPDAPMQAVEAALEQALGALDPDLKIDVSIVLDFPPSEGATRRTIISHVGSTTP